MNCTKCGSDMSFRSGRFGNFWGCKNYPKCDHTIPIKGSKSFVKKEVVQPASIKLVKGSEQQERIWAFMMTGTGHLVVHACPGTGKTFSLVQGTARLDLQKYSVVYFAFNNSIRDEMLLKAPQGVTVLGLNQFGFRVCISAFKRTKLDDNKYYKLFQELFPATSPDEIKLQSYCAYKAKELVSLCQSYMVDGTNEDEVLEILERHELRLPKDHIDRIVSSIPKLLEQGKRKTATVSFGDQLWLPVVLDLPTPQYDIITIDEAQDLNKVQHQLVMRTLHKNSRVVVVGDENQAIYAFRGADVDSMDAMASMLSQTGKEVVHFPLTKTWRCGKKIVELAQQYVPEIEAHESNPEGDVVSATLESVEDDIAAGDMILCRMNGPLVTLGYRLMRKGKKVHFQGRQFGENIVALAQGLQASSVNDLMMKLNRYEDNELEKLENAKAAGQSVALKKVDLQDKIECIRVFLSTQDEDASIEHVISEMNSFFCSDGNENESITLSSIHRAKGRERDRIFYYKPEISFDNLADWEENSERNLKFVAITRAKKYLCMVSGPEGE